MMNDIDETESTGETHEAQAAAAGNPSRTRAERIVFALRQGVVLSVCLVVGGGLVGALRPDAAPTRDITASPFMWAAVLWVVVLLVDAVWFDQSQVRRFEREPLVLAAMAAIVTFMVGLVSFDAGSTLERIVYLGANALGALVFWWAVFSLFWLLSRLSRSTGEPDAG